MDWEAAARRQARDDNRPPRAQPTWRALAPTLKQLDYIERYGSADDGPFTTRGHASDYIEGIVLAMKLGKYGRPA